MNLSENSCVAGVAPWTGRAFSAVFGPETFFRGTLRGEDNYLVCGQAEADADLDGLFVLAVGGCWRGSITAAHVVIAGEVHGNVSAR